MNPGGAEEALRIAERTAADPARAVSRWKALSGGKAVGCLPPFVPEEVLHAAGLLPVTVCGDEPPGSPSERPWGILDAWVFPPVPAIPHGSLSFLAETLSAVPRISLSFSLRGMKVPSAEEALDRVEMLREWAGELSGRPVTDGALAKSLASYRENRGLRADLQSRMAAAPGLYSAAEIFGLFRSGMALPREAHSMLLRAALCRIPTAEKRFTARVFLVGLTAWRQVMEAIDAAGATVAGEAFDAEDHGATVMSGKEGDPALAAARRLRSRLLCLAEEEADPTRANRLLDRAEACGADRVLHLGGGAARTGGSGKLDVAARERGMPFLRIERDPAGRTREGQIERISSFLRELRH